MNKISFLDCTLRDGGYINDWRFGNLTIRSVIARLDAAGVDYIEIGFLDDRQAFDNERSMFPEIGLIRNTCGNLHPKHAKLVAMIDIGTFDEKRLIPASESCLYGIRLIFTKDKTSEALAYAHKIKEKGYHLFLNLVSTSSYRDEELAALAKEINVVKPTAVSIVDTYGLMFEEEMADYARILDRVLSPEIALGYHSHNNMQMSNANSIEFIRLKLARDIIVDSSLLGMGKNAGNACTELMLSFANNVGIGKFDISQVSECAYIDIGKFQGKANWGYHLEFLISAIMRCSPNWTKHYMKEKTLSIKDICNILAALPDDKKYLPSFFKTSLAEQLLNDYISKNVNDEAGRTALQQRIEHNNLLLICPGNTMSTHKEEINDYIRKKQPVTISVNFIPSDIKLAYVWVSNSVRYSQISSLYEELSKKPEMLLTSNITPLPPFDSKFVFNFQYLYNQIGGSISVVLLLELLLSLGAREIALAGFDGYDVSMKNYFDSGYNLSFDEQSNERIAAQLKTIIERYDCNQISFVTPSRFECLFKEKDNREETVNEGEENDMTHTAKILGGGV